MTAARNHAALAMGQTIAGVGRALDMLVYVGGADGISLRVTGIGGGSMGSQP
jgi:hypothetical protein